MNDDALFERLAHRVAGLLFDSVHAHLSTLLSQHHSPIEGALDRLERRQEHLIHLAQEQKHMTQALLDATASVESGLDAQGTKLAAMTAELSTATSSIQTQIASMQQQIADLTAQTAGDPDVAPVVARLSASADKLGADNAVIDDVTTRLGALMNGGAPTPEPVPTSSRRG